MTQAKEMAQAKGKKTIKKKRKMSQETDVRRGLKEFINSYDVFYLISHLKIH